MKTKAVALDCVGPWPRFVGLRSGCEVFVRKTHRLPKEKKVGFISPGADAWSV